MSACKDWREQLMDYALGRPASVELKAHLLACNACAEALDALRVRARRIDAGIRRAATLEPRPELAERILAEVDAIHSAPRWTWAWKATAALAAAAMALVVIVYQQRVSRQRDREQVFAAAAALSKWRAPTDGLLRSRSDDWLRTVPRLGTTFFEMKSKEDPSAQEKQNP